MGRGLDGFLIPVLVGCVVLRVCEARSRTISGGFGVGETPLPIPNRAVKPHSADGTWPSRAWESRSPPVLHTSCPPRRGFVSRPPGRLDSLMATTEVDAGADPTEVGAGADPRWSPTERQLRPGMEAEAPAAQPLSCLSVAIQHSGRTVSQRRVAGRRPDGTVA